MCREILLSTQEHSDSSRLIELLGTLVYYAKDIACHFILETLIFPRCAFIFSIFPSLFFFLFFPLLSAPLHSSLLPPQFIPQFYCIECPLVLICLWLLVGSNSHVLLHSDVLPLMFLLSSSFTGGIQSPTQISQMFFRCLYGRVGDKSHVYCGFVAARPLLALECLDPQSINYLVQ